MTGGDEFSKEARVLAAFMHSAYENAAESEEWETQDGTSVPFDDLPEENRRTMLRVAEEVLWYFESDGSDLSESAIRRALNAVEDEAQSHGGDYAAGVRMGRVVLEQELLSTLRRTDA